MGKVIYLTGAPAAGKSSTTRLLSTRLPALQIWEYGAKLTEHVQGRASGVVDQDDLRSKSATAISAQDVRDVDDALLAFVDLHRGSSDVIIDSHAVTKEGWGFRVIPFSLERFGMLAPNEIWMLFTPPGTAVERIAADSGGRPMIDEEQARMHTQLQASVAATYAMSLGVPLYLFDSPGHQGELVDALAEHLA